MMPAESEDNYDCPSTSRHLQASVFQFALRVCRAETWALAPAARPENNKRSKSKKFMERKRRTWADSSGNLKPAAGLVAVWRVADAGHDLCGELRPAPH